MIEIVLVIVTVIVLTVVVIWWLTRKSSVTPGKSYPDISGGWGVMQGNIFRQHVTMSPVGNGQFEMRADDSHEYSVLTFDDQKHISAQPKNADGSDRGVPIRAFLLNDTTLIVGGDEALGWGNGTVYHRVSFVKK